MRYPVKQYDNIYMITGEPDYQKKTSGNRLSYHDIIKKEDNIR